MEAYYSSSSSSSSLHLTHSPQVKNQKQSQHFHTSLHSVRRLQPAKLWKKPIAPLPPTPPRVYQVEPKNFRELVQKLTGAPDLQSRRLRSIAPPPLNLGPSPLSGSELLSSPQKTPMSALYQNLMSETFDTKTHKLSDCLAASNSIGLGLTPSSSSYMWCSFPVLSPGTLSSLEQSTVL